MIYVDDKGNYAKLIEYNQATDMVVVVINDKAVVMAYDEFIRVFRSILK